MSSDASNVLIRLVKARDFAEIRAMWQEASKVHEQVNPIFALAEDASLAFEEDGLRHVESGMEEVFVADWNGLAIGFCLVGYKSRSRIYAEQVHGEIVNLVVTPQLRNRGIGMQLVIAALDWLKEREIRFVEVTYLPSDGAARAIFSHLGFDLHTETRAKIL